MKKCSALVIIYKMQINTTNTIKIGHFKKPKPLSSAPNVGKNVDCLGLQHLVDEMVQPFWKRPGSVS